MEKLQILSGLRSLKPLIEREVEKMPITLNLKDNEFFKEAFAEGERKGFQKGEQKGFQKGEQKGEYLLLL